MTREIAVPERRAATVRGWVPDVVVATLLVLVFVAVSYHIPVPAHGRSVDAFGYVLLVVAGASMAWARRRPAPVLGVVTVTLGCYIARDYANGPMFIAAWLALLALSWRTTRRSGLIGAAVLCVVLAAAQVVAGGSVFSPVPLFFVGWSAAAVFLGDALRNRRGYLAELEERARSLEHSQELEARRRVAEDRLRIARDLHDSVAHAMATINVQAGAAAHVLDRNPEVAKGAFTAIQRASGEVLDELAAMLTLLREDGEAADRAPTPGIEQLPHLVEATRGTGLQVQLTIEGPTDEVSKPVGTVAYRIVQESLTNVIRHSGASAAQVTVRADNERGLIVDVSDDGREEGHEADREAEPGVARTSSGTGTGIGTGIGIRGMRERAESTGGRLETGRAPHGGFTVRATWDGRS